MIRPLRDRIVVRPLDEPPLSTVLHVVTEDHKESRGQVLAVGPSVKFGTKYRPRTPSDTQVGDRISFTDIFKFPEIRVDGERLLILQEADVCWREAEAGRNAA